jgi:hypothetical protein
VRPRPRSSLSPPTSRQRPSPLELIPLQHRCHLLLQIPYSQPHPGQKNPRRVRRPVSSDSTHSPQACPRIVNSRLSTAPPSRGSTTPRFIPQYRSIAQLINCSTALAPHVIPHLEKNVATNTIKDDASLKLNIPPSLPHLVLHLIQSLLFNFSTAPLLNCSRAAPLSSSEFRASDLIRHSNFVIRHSPAHKSLFLPLPPARASFSARATTPGPHSP